MKKVQLLLLFFFTLPLYAHMKQISLTMENIPLHIRFLKLQGFFKHKHVFLNTHTFYKIKIKNHTCLDSQTLSSFQKLALFLLFSVIDGFEWFWIESLHNIQLMLEFLEAPFLVLHFSCYSLMTFLSMLSVILLSMLMILLFILSVIRHLICGNNLNWLLNLNLIYKTLWTGERSGFLISVMGKLSWFCLICLITLVLLM